MLQQHQELELAALRQAEAVAEVEGAAATEATSAAAIPARPGRRSVAELIDTRSANGTRSLVLHFHHRRRPHLRWASAAQWASLSDRGTGLAQLLFPRLLRPLPIPLRQWLGETIVPAPPLPGSATREGRALVAWPPASPWRRTAACEMRCAAAPLRQGCHRCSLPAPKLRHRPSPWHWRCARRAEACARRGPWRRSCSHPLSARASPARSRRHHHCRPCRRGVQQWCARCAPRTSCPSPEPHQQ